MLGVPEGASAVVLFAHGSGSSRLSPRNRFVAETLRKGGIGTLLIDLLTEEEDSVYETRFDIGLLTTRLAEVVGWLGKRPEGRGLPIGLFGASTGAAAALHVAARLGDHVSAVVSRGGRPDLAMDVLDRVVSPTLLIVGGEDREVIRLNEAAYRVLRCEKELEIVPGATHLFEEPGTLEQVAGLALDWFRAHTPRPEGPNMTFELTSPAFQNGGIIPSKLTCDGADVSPALHWPHAHADAKSLVLICDDPDAPAGTWVHWVLYGLAPDRTSLGEGVPRDPVVEGIGVQGKNDFKRIGYGGPCPPPGKPHRYFFKLYALDSKLGLKPGATKSDVEKAMRGHVVAQGQLMGKYQR
jgi:Raf kinase inhibitor-like YbhB/YbcL family protein